MKITEYRRWLGADPERDATKKDGNPTAHIISQDWEKSVRCSCAYCAISTGYKRTYNLDPDDGAFIMNQVAYLKMPDPKSPTGRTAIRWRIPTKAHRIWDSGKWQPNQIVTLLIPTRSFTLDGKIERSQAVREKRALRVALGLPPRPKAKGKYVPPRGYSGNGHITTSRRNKRNGQARIEK
jgi:hypothetical protein